MSEVTAIDSRSQQNDVARVVQLATDPSLLSALGRGHSMPSAIADLVDNAIEWHATRIGIRFMVRAGFVESIRISDDGNGMTGARLRDAMTLGRRRTYDAGALSHFGMGLKSASMSQCARLQVYTKCANEPVHGVRLLRDDAGGRFEFDVLTESAAWAGYHRGTHRGIESTGTVVEWSLLDGVSVASLPSVRQRWLDDVINTVRGELGLTFHRLIAQREVRIEIDEFDLDYDEAGVPRVVDAIDPFGFHIEGRSGYPKAIDARLASGAVIRAVCHVLPPGASGPSARILGRPRLDWQGLYIYRNGRLLQAGGWLSLLPDHRPDWQLARVAIDLNETALTAVSINPEKRGVVLRPEFVQALEAGGAADGTTFREYLAHAREVVQAANARRASGPKPVTPLRDGLPDASLASMVHMLGARADVPAASITWRALDEDRIFTFDHGARVLWLNAGYRAALGPGADALAQSVYLLIEGYFARDRPQQGTLDQIEAWQRVLATTVLSQVGKAAYDPVRSESDDDGAIGVVDPTAQQTEHTAGRAQPLPGVPSPATVRHIVDGRRAASPPAEPDNGSFDTPEKPQRELVERHERAARRGEVTDAGELFESLAATPLPSDELINDLRRKLDRYPLLTAPEETALARQIEVGVLAQDRLDSLGDDERNGRFRRELAQLVADGRRAYDRFAGSNLRLVFSIAATRNHRGIEYADLVQEGILGLLRAIEKFDFDAGFKFSTYATWWIRQSIDRSLADRGRTIRIPVHMVEQQHKVLAAQRRLESELGRTPTTSELSQAVEMPEKDVTTSLGYVYGFVSLDLNVSDHGAETTLAELLIDSAGVDPLELLEAADLSGALVAAVKSAPDRQSAVLIARFGLDGKPPRTLDAIGDAHGVTRERIRQIEKKALDRLRSSQFEYLHDYLDLDFDRIGVGALGPIRQSVPDPARHSVYPPQFRVAPKPHTPATAAPSSPHSLGVGDNTLRPEPAGEQPQGGSAHEAIAGDSDAALIADLYRKGATLAAIEAETAMPVRDVVGLLGHLLLSIDQDGAADDDSLAPRHDLPWEPTERERVLDEFRRGATATRIAADRGRTPLAIAWQLLDSPRRPVVVPKKLVRNLRRSSAGSLSGSTEQAG